MTVKYVNELVEALVRRRRGVYSKLKNSGLVLVSGGTLEWRMLEHRSDVFSVRRLGEPLSLLTLRGTASLHSGVQVRFSQVGKVLYVATKGGFYHTSRSLGESNNLFQLLEGDKCCRMVIEEALGATEY
ncbi:unnamed protein product [Angiostrongylus costaricensis]|uniref:BPH_3 domain-containing protein n=1 Tax=Angiostrongylus costaricensis TaxID=334426 RepID=A0A0R3Q071_ANGCS|nr:unnamed protein product [Angiostrongylus costaricensis]